MTTDELYVVVNEIKVDQARMATQMENQQKLLENFTDLVLTVRDIVNVQTNMVEEMKCVRKDIDEIKTKPAKRWDVIIAAIITGIVGFAISKFLA